MQFEKLRLLEPLCPGAFLPLPPYPLPLEPLAPTHPHFPAKLTAPVTSVSEALLSSPTPFNQRIPVYLWISTANRFVQAALPETTVHPGPPPT